MSARVTRLIAGDRAHDRRFLERLRNEGYVAKVLWNLARARSRDEGERDFPVAQGGSKLKALTVEHIDIEKGEFEYLGQALPRFRH